MIFNPAALGLASKLAQTYLKDTGFNFSHPLYNENMISETVRHYLILEKARQQITTICKEEVK